MKILLDECVTKHLKPYLPNHDVYTVRDMQWSGIKNGKLMALCVEYSFDILLTIDKNLQYQQNLNRYPVSIVVLNSISSKVDALTEFLPAFNQLLNSIESGKAYIINK